MHNSVMPTAAKGAVWSPQLFTLAAQVYSCCGFLAPHATTQLQQFRYRLALSKRSREPQHRPEGWHQIGGLDRTVENHSFTDAGSHRHHPGCAGKRIAGAMMLKSVTSGIVVRVPAKIRQNEQSRVGGVFRLTLDRLP